MPNSIIHRLLNGPHSGYTLILIGAIIIGVRACYYDVFIDESEAAPSEIATEKRGLKATPLTRGIMITIAFLIGAFAVWKLWQP
jgi:hypothetical protein